MLLIAIYLITALLTELITNNAVAAIMFPIAFAMAQQIGVDPRPMIIAISIAASMSFISPVGYQTNLMVMGPGGYPASQHHQPGHPGRRTHGHDRRPGPPWQRMAPRASDGGAPRGLT
jgi:di/tricarboxylate transporter